MICPTCIKRWAPIPKALYKLDEKTHMPVPINTTAKFLRDRMYDDDAKCYCKECSY